MRVNLILTVSVLSTLAVVEYWPPIVTWLSKTGTSLFTGAEWQRVWVVTASLSFLLLLMAQHHLRKEIDQIAEHEGRSSERHLSCILLGLVTIAFLNYCANSDKAGSSADFALFVGGISFGLGFKCLDLWFRRHIGRSLGPMVIISLIVVLAPAPFLNCEATNFSYRGEPRWNGPWTNPNTFGLLMGMAATLTCGTLLHVAQSGDLNCLFNPKKWRFEQRWFALAAGLVAFVLFMVCVVKSYSRSAWLGTTMAFVFLAYATSKQFDSRGISVQMRLPSVLTTCACLIVLIGALQQMEHPVFRRIVSVIDLNDFSWRNRIVATKGLLQMTADQPLLGTGWTMTYGLYNSLYRPRTTEATAVVLNDFLGIGSILGIPALLLMVTYIALNIDTSWKRRVNFQDLLDDAAIHRRGTCRNRGYLKKVATAGAVVLLTGLWFDRGLTILYYAAPLWILLAFEDT